MDWSAVLGPAALIPLWNAGVRLAMPTALAAVGETLTERAGILNLGLEGIMLVGGVTSFLANFYTGSVWLGVLAGMGAGLAMSSLMGVLSITLKTEQVVNGISLVLLGAGISALAYEQLFGVTATPPRLDALPKIAVPGLSEIPGLGSILFEQNALFYLSVILALSVWWLLFRTRFGLSVRAVGETPAAADASGIGVDRIRWLALSVGGVMTGLAGAVLVIGQLNLFAPNVTAGRGWVAIALVILGRWNPLIVFGGALVFGLTDALQLRIQAAGGGIDSLVPYEMFQALPYLVTLVVMTVTSARTGRDAQPSALGVPFRKEVRD